MANITYRNPHEEVAERIITGLHSFDEALKDKSGRKGIPLRSLWEISGHTGVGKTSFGLSLLGLIGKHLNRDISLIDFERQNDDTLNGALDGVMFNGKLDVVSYDVNERSEDTLETSIQILYDDIPNLILLDSIGAFTPTAEIEGKIGDANVGVKGRLIGQWSRKAIRALQISELPSMLMFTNHLHQDFGAKSFVPIYKTTGGTTKKYLATHAIRLKEVYNQTFVEEGAWLLEGKVEKNRDGYSDRTFNVCMVAGEGINHNLTAMFDCIMSAGELATVNNGVVNLQGQKFQRVRKMIEQRFDSDLFAPFHNALRASNLTQSQSTEEVEEPKKKSKKDKE